MKKNAILLILLFLITNTTLAQRGKVFDNLSVKSAILKMDRKFAIYLPPDYESSSRSYPVLYLLHGAGDDQTGWVQFGEVLNITDKAIANGKATPMIIVMPDANTGQRGYFNSPNGDWGYEDFFFDELMPFVETNYRIKGEKRFRAIAGLSMGGGGSFMYAMHRPDLFSSAAPLSAYIGPLTLEQFKQQAATQINGLDEGVVVEYFNRHNALSLVNSAESEKFKNVRWFIDCGDDDFLFEGNSLLHIAMRKKEIPHEYRVRQGGHTWTYWRESLPVVLQFVSDAFHQY
ncbi:MAG: enterochelin esterase-like enzyme [Roseivirga sp.]|jgi:enterochelin esterase-like enzyme